MDFTTLIIIAIIYNMICTQDKQKAKYFKKTGKNTYAYIGKH